MSRDDNDVAGAITQSVDGPVGLGEVGVISVGTGLSVSTDSMWRG